METYSFGEWLKRRRERLRLTQRELAESVHCSIAMLKKIEADERRPSPELARLLAIALQIAEPEQRRFVEVARGEHSVDALWQVQPESARLTTAGHAPVPLPEPVTPFIGRTHELHFIQGRLTQPHCRLLTLVGTGGVGKTRLALAAATALKAVFADGVSFIPLTTITDTSMIPDAFARSLRLLLTGQAAESVLAYLRHRSMLLLLDNCEQLEGDLDWLSELMALAPGVKLLATSRERLHLTEEWVYVVPELTEAAALFVETAQRVKDDFDANAERTAVDRICRLVENLPLAVELAAGWTPLMTCSQIAESIQRDIHILATEVRNVPERHRSMEAVFQHSWNLLSPAEQHALMRFTVFRGGWSVDEALSVADADLMLMRRLVDKSFVRTSEQNRYSLHELIRQFASYKLVQTGSDDETRQRHFDACLALAADLNERQFTAESMAVLARFDQEHDNIRAALDWSLNTGQTEAALHLMYHLWFYWSRRGLYREGSEWALRAIHHAGVLASVHLSIALSSAAALLFIQGRYSEAEPMAQRGREMAQRLEDAEALIMALGTYTFSSTNIDQALSGLHEGIALIEKTGRAQELLPLLYQGAATWFHSSGRYTEASNYYWKSVTLFRTLGAVDFIADPLGRLGQLALEEGRLQEAYDRTVESIAAARSAGYDVVFHAWGGARLGLIQLYMGDIEAAQQSIEEALLFFEDGNDARVKQEALAFLSEVALARGDAEGAAQHLQASLEICRMLYSQLQATGKLDGTLAALPVDLIGLSARAALVASVQGNDVRAVTLYSIANSFHTQSGQVMLSPLQTRLDEAASSIRARLLRNEFEIAWEAGQHMSITQAFAFLLG